MTTSWKLLLINVKITCHPVNKHLLTACPKQTELNYKRECPIRDGLLRIRSSISSVGGPFKFPLREADSYVT